MTRSADDLVEQARLHIDRTARRAGGRAGPGGLVVDIRPAAQRVAEGELPGALVVERNVLEWRLDPHGYHRLPEATGFDRPVVVVCSEGYASSLAADSLRQLGYRQAGDLIGGYRAWRAVGPRAQDPARVVRRTGVRRGAVAARRPISEYNGGRGLPPGGIRRLRQCPDLGPPADRRGDRTGVDHHALEPDGPRPQRGIWLIGFALMLVVFGLQATALRFGELSVVQPVLTTELLFLLLILGVWFRYHLGWQEWIGAGHHRRRPGRLLPGRGTEWRPAQPSNSQFLVASAILIAAIAGCIVAALRGPRWWRAAAFGAATAVTAAFSAAITKSITTYISRGLGPRLHPRPALPAGRDRPRHGLPAAERPPRRSHHRVADHPGHHQPAGQHRPRASPCSPTACGPARCGSASRCWHWPSWRPAWWCWPARLWWPAPTRRGTWTRCWATPATEHRPPPPSRVAAASAASAAEPGTATTS